MTFVYPAFLWALAALSIPIIIHLFNFRRTRKVFFSNTRFLKQVKEVTTAKRRLKHYLILASRLLFLFFLVMTFAQPLLPARQQFNSERPVILYIDNSQSMSAQLPDKTRGLDASLRFAQNIVFLLPADTRYKIITNDFAPFSNTFKTKPEAVDLLAQIRLSPVSRTMDEIRDRINQERGRKREVFWLSDFQKSTIGTIPTWDSTDNLHLVPIAFQPTPNVFVDTAFLENPFAARGERNVLNLKLRNDGNRSAEDLNINLTINGVQAGTAQISVPAKSIAETKFDLASGLRGRNKGRVSFADFPVSFDNDFYVALNFTDKVNIVEIKPSSATTTVEKVFGNSQIFEFNAYAVTNFTYSLLNQAELVIVNGLDRVDASLAMALREYLSTAKGSVLVVPGKVPDVTSYKQLLGIPGIQVNQNALLTELDKPDYGNPFFENVFEEKTSSLSMPKAKQLLLWGSDRSAILRFRNDAPFLSRFTQGGNLYLLSSPLEQGYTDFSNHALFVPVMYRLAASARTGDQRLYFSVQENFIRMKLDTIRGNVKFVGEQEFIPSQRQVSNELFLEVPKYSINPGFYYLTDERDSLDLIAFNLNKSESLLDQYSGKEIKNQMGNGGNITIFEAESADSFSGEIRERYLGKPLWKYALMLALFFLLIEVLLIRFLK